METKIIDLGTIKKKHCSGMMETDKGFKLPASAGIEIGDQLVQNGARKFFMKKTEWDELVKATEVDKVPKIMYQAGVTKKLRDKASALGLTTSETTTKEVLLKAIDEAELAKLVVQAKALDIEDTDAMTKEELIIAIKGEQ